VTLVGGAFQATHRHMLLGYALGGRLHQGPVKPVWQRRDSEGGGIVPGSGGAFLVLESAGHAAARGARIYARLASVLSDRVRRDGAEFSHGVGRLLDRLAPDAEETLVISGASGAHAAAAAEMAALADRSALRVRGMSTAVGHLQEAQFPFAVALAALAVSKTAAYPAFDPNEGEMTGAPKAALATMIGYNSGEGAALVTAAD
jgi:3-oxoacyl-[acyl-carrier-protein] synthase II